MVIAIRIVLSLIALIMLYWMLAWSCYIDLNPFGQTHWRIGCATRFLAIAISIPLALAFVVGYLKKSQTIFWNTFVGVLFTGSLVSFIYEYFL